MNRKLLVSLLQKNIDELAMITEGFMEMNEYPKAIVVLARRKTEDIQLLIDELAEVKFEQNKEPELAVVETKAVEPQVELQPEAVVAVDSVPELETEVDDIKLVVENIEDYKLDYLLDEKDDVEIADVELEDIVEETEEEVFVVEEVVEEVVEPTAVVEPEIVPQAPVAPVEEIKIEDAPEIIVSEVTIPEIAVPSIEPVYVEKVELTESHTKTTAHTESFNPAETSKKETTVVTEETKRTIIGERIINPTVSRNEVHQKADNSLSATLANKKVDDIKQAISIGDRFRFQRELFRGNGEEMNKTLTYLNQLATLKEAQAFLQSKYNWAADSEAAEDFYQILKRKY